MTCCHPQGRVRGVLGVPRHTLMYQYRGSVSHFLKSKCLVKIQFLHFVWGVKLMSFMTALNNCSPFFTCIRKSVQSDHWIRHFLLSIPTSLSTCLSVRTSVRRGHLGSHWTDFSLNLFFEYFSKTCREILIMYVRITN